MISKIIEKVVAVGLQKYLEANQLNEPLQSVDKTIHSCETALVRVHNDIFVAIDKRHCVMLLLLDLSAAFDTVDHDILLTRLHSKYSISGIALEWFRSYLTNRSQFAKGVDHSLASSSAVYLKVLSLDRFLKELSSKFYYLPSKLCISNLQPTFKTLSPATYLLDRFGHPLRSVWILLALTLRPMDLEHSLSQPPNFGTNYPTTYAHVRIA